MIQYPNLSKPEHIKKNRRQQNKFITVKITVHENQKKIAAHG